FPTKVKPDLGTITSPFSGASRTLDENHSALPIGRLSVVYDQAGVKYEVGQPMGAYSSWAMLALTHHIVVLYAAKLAGV
ncbi:hypothetical protein FBU30_002438, partial [Linnemannia zychae]